MIKPVVLSVLLFVAAASAGTPMAIAADPKKADAYFISCANIHSIDVIADLEKALLRPVVTSNQAALWCALRTLGLPDAAPELGALFGRTALAAEG